jgi:hypothetical protein
LIRGFFGGFFEKKAWQKTLIIWVKEKAAGEREQKARRFWNGQDRSLRGRANGGPCRGAHCAPDACGQSITTPDYGENFRCRQTLMNFVFDILMIE